jgi:hypothetical protein
MNVDLDDTNYIVEVNNEVSGVKLTRQKAQSS